MLAGDAAFAEGVALYEAGRYWHAHEAWEPLWRAAADDAHRRLLQGLIQVSAALYKLTECADAEACARILDRAAGKLRGLPEVLGGVDVGALREGVDRCAAEVRGGRVDPAPPRVVVAP
jgi:uncharacterized protein